MANLTIVAAQVAAVKIFDSFTVPRAEAVPIGGYGRLNTAGKLALGNATSAGEIGNVRGLVFELLGNTARAMSDGILDLGDALDGMDVGDLVYLSDTDGLLADGADGTVDLVVGAIVPGFGELTASKLLRVRLNVSPGA